MNIGIYRINLASKLDETKKWFLSANNFKYSKAKIQEIINGPKIQNMIQDCDAFITDFNKDNPKDVKRPIRVDDFIARILRIDIEGQFAEVMCGEKTYLKSHLFMESLDHVSLGFVLVGEFQKTKNEQGEDVPFVDTDGYRILKVTGVTKFQLITDTETSQKAELITQRDGRLNDGSYDENDEPWDDNEYEKESF